MNTDFITIKDAIADNKGNFVATVSKIGDLKSGTRNGKDWSMKKITVEDATASLEIGCFNEEMELFKIGCKYEILPWWKERYEGNPNVGIGKYGQVKLIGTDKVVESTSKPEETRGEVGDSLPKPDLGFKTFIMTENIELAQISKVVRTQMELLNPLTSINGQELGLRVKEIYREWKKASRS